MGRAPCCSKIGLRRGPWTAREDALLITYVKAHGQGQWRSVPNIAGLLRCGKSCRLRWMNYLRPDIKRGDFTPDEDDIIVRMHALLGNRWSLIAGRLPGRTDNEIKNYWNSRLSKKLSTKRIKLPCSVSYLLDDSVAVHGCHQEHGDKNNVVGGHEKCLDEKKKKRRNVMGGHENAVVFNPKPIRVTTPLTRNLLVAHNYHSNNGINIGITFNSRDRGGENYRGFTESAAAEGWSNNSVSGGDGDGISFDINEDYKDKNCGFVIYGLGSNVDEEIGHDYYDREVSANLTDKESNLEKVYEEFLQLLKSADRSC